MTIVDSIKTVVDRRGFQSISLPLINWIARLQGRGVQRIFLNDGIWIHQTSQGYFAYHQPYLRLHLVHLDDIARRNYFWGYTPKAGDVVMEVGAGVGEETLTFSRAVGERGKVISIEAHPRTFRCLEKLVQYNRLKNVLPLHAAVTEPGYSEVTIKNESDYLANRFGAVGVSVPATTIDAVYKQLNLRRINFLKMNIEGSERLAIRGMAETLKQTEILCVSCHDFLAEKSGDDELRTKRLVRAFLQQNGLDVLQREHPSLPAYVRDQLWAYNHILIQAAAS